MLKFNSNQDSQHVKQLEQALNGLVQKMNESREQLLDFHDISELEVELLLFVSVPPQKKMKEIGAHLEIKLSTLTSVVDKLESQSMVVRQNSKDDRRVIFILPSENGLRFLDSLSMASKQLARAIEEMFGPDHFNTFVKGFSNLVLMFKNEQSTPSDSHSGT